MTDVFSKKKRSEIMSHIRSKNTGIEKKVFSFLRKQHISFNRHYSKIPGKPDIAIPAKKIAVFINGDFWHGYRFAAWRLRIPRKYWRDKIASNIARDKKRYSALRRAGWRVLRIWGHEINQHPEKTFQKIVSYLSS